MNPVGILGNMMYLEGRVLKSSTPLTPITAMSTPARKAGCITWTPNRMEDTFAVIMPAKVIRYITFSIVDFVLIINTSL